MREKILEAQALVFAKRYRRPTWVIEDGIFYCLNCPFQHTAHDTPGHDCPHRAVILPMVPR